MCIFKQGSVSLLCLINKFLNYFSITIFFNIPMAIAIGEDIYKLLQNLYNCLHSDIQKRVDRGPYIIVTKVL